MLTPKVLLAASVDQGCSSQSNLPKLPHLPARFPVLISEAKGFIQVYPMLGVKLFPHVFMTYRQRQIARSDEKSYGCSTIGCAAFLALDLIRDFLAGS